MTAQSVLAAWYEWDDRPKDQNVANSLCDEIVAFAARIGTDFTTVRRAMASGRRNGTDRSVILTGLEAAPGGETDRNPKGPNQ